MVGTMIIKLAENDMIPITAKSTINLLDEYYQNINDDMQVTL